MKWIGLLALGFTASLSLTGEVQAANAFGTGNELLVQCEATHPIDAANVDLLDAGVCLGYVTAIADALRNGPLLGYKACVPNDANINKGEIADVVLKYLRDHPEKRHFLAPGLVAGALSQAFPCRK